MKIALFGAPSTLMHPSQPSNDMIKVEWPLLPQADEDLICDWLEELVNLDKTRAVFELDRDHYAIYFYREDDAIAFKLKFQL